MEYPQGKFLSFALAKITDSTFEKERHVWDSLGIKLYHMRWVVLGTNMLFALLGGHVTLGGLFASLAGLGLVAVFFERLRQRVSIQVLNAVIIPLDFLFVTVAILYSGGLHSDSYLLYLSEIITITLYYGRRAGFVAAIFSVCLYGIVIHHDLQTFFEFMSFFYRISMILLFSLSVAYVGQYLRMHIMLNREMAEENRLLAYTDLLTGLGNSRVLYEKLDQLLSGFNSDGKPFSLLMFDCDNLKVINDCYGHDAGDMLIQQIGHIGREVFSPVGSVFRYAGDEFYVLFEGMDGALVSQLAEQFIQRVTDNQVCYNSHSFSTTVSVGTVNFIYSTKSNFTRADAVRLADQALYESKKNGKACVTSYKVSA